MTKLNGDDGKKEGEQDYEQQLSEQLAEQRAALEGIEEAIAEDPLEELVEVQTACCSCDPHCVIMSSSAFPSNSIEICCPTACSSLAAHQAMCCNFGQMRASLVEAIQELEKHLMEMKRSRLLSMLVRL